MPRNNKNKQVLTFLFLVIFLSFTRVSFAAGRCEVEEGISASDAVLNQWKWISSAGKGFITHFVFDGIAGLRPNQVMGCEKYIFNTLSTSAPGAIATAGSEDELCDGTEEVICHNAVYGSAAFSAYATPEYFQAYRDSEIAGSLLGMTQLVDDYLYHEPPPANMAYYWNDSIKNIPVLNKALAATTYEHKLINAVLNIWKGVRNIALGLMSIILLYMGILIILRKKVNSQLVVSVQYAIPKIIIGLVLIIFSYPIGAMITSLGWTLFHSAKPIIDAVFNFSSAEHSMNIGAGYIGLALMAILITVFVAGMNIPVLLAIIILALVILILYFGVKIKAFVIYLKMVFSIISAPVEFAIGTVPGSESRIMEWFKRMAKYLVTLFFMGGIVHLCVVLSLMIIKDYTSQGTGTGFFISMAAPLFVLLFGFGLAISMDKKVGEFFGDKPTYKK